MATRADMDHTAAGEPDESPDVGPRRRTASLQHRLRRFGRVRRTALLSLVVAFAGLGLAACQPQEPVTGVYSVNVNGSQGELTVRQSGAGATARFTVTVSSPFKPSGFTCSLPAGTVVARFAGTAPSFSETFARFNATTCVKLGDNYTSGAVATLNGDKSLTLGLPTSGSVAQSALLVRTGAGTSVATSVAAGNYAVNVNGSQGALTVHQSGSGASAVHTVTVSSPLKLTGFTCSLTPGTVVARFTGAGPSFGETFARFDATTCAKLGDNSTSGAVALLNIDNSITLGLPSADAIARTALLVRTGPGTSVATPVAAGTYSVNVNGSQGALTVHQSGSGASAVHTVTVSSPLKLTGYTCSLTPGTVVARFTGAGPSFGETFARFDATTCAKLGDNSTSGAVALLNIDNSITLGLPSADAIARTALLVRTGPGTSVATPVAAGTYSVNVNGSQGALTVHQSGSGASAVHTVTVGSPLKLTGFTCSLTPGTVVARFTGAGPSFGETFARFDATTCAKLGDNSTSGAVALLNTNNSITLGLPSADAIARTALLVRTGPGTSVATPVAAGTYSANVNGSQVALTVHQSGSGASAIHTVTVTSPFTPTGLTCSVAPGTVVARFSGAGPSFGETFARFDATTCAKLGDNSTSGAVALLNTDNSITLGLPSADAIARTALLVRI